MTSIKLYQKITHQIRKKKNKTSKTLLPSLDPASRFHKSSRVAPKLRLRDMVYFLSKVQFYNNHFKISSKELKLSIYKRISLPSSAQWIAWTV